MYARAERCQKSLTFSVTRAQKFDYSFAALHCQAAKLPKTKLPRLMTHFHSNPNNVVVCQADPHLMSHFIIVAPWCQEWEREREREFTVAVAVAIYLTLGSLARLSRCVYVIIHKPRKGAIIIACCATTPRPIKQKKQHRTEWKTARMQQQEQRQRWQQRWQQQLH